MTVQINTNITLYNIYTVAYKVGLYIHMWYLQVFKYIRINIFSAYLFHLWFLHTYIECLSQIHIVHIWNVHICIYNFRMSLPQYIVQNGVCELVLCVGYPTGIKRPPEAMVPDNKATSCFSNVRGEALQSVNYSGSLVK